MVEAWFTQGSAGKKFCETYFPNAKFLIIGHFHREGCWINRGLHVINTGSFIAPGRAHWIEWNEGWLTRGVVNESPKRCEKGRVLNVWRWT
jgi:UDP-2,3-diacylglucosamine pyrophosphatase LpxH